MNLFLVSRSTYPSPAFSVEIKASYETNRMLRSGGVIGELSMSWDELLDHGDELLGERLTPHSSCTSTNIP
jgi:hypothetical protein